MFFSKKKKKKRRFTNWRYLKRLNMEDKKCNTRIRRHFGIAKYVFQKLRKVWTKKNRKDFVRNKKIRLQHYYVKSILFNGRECGGQFSHRRRQATFSTLIFEHGLVHLLCVECLLRGPVVAKSVSRRRVWAVRIATEVSWE